MQQLGCDVISLHARGIRYESYPQCSQPVFKAD